MGDMWRVVYRGYGVNGIFTSAMICRRRKLLNEKVKRVNFSLRFVCEENRNFLYKIVTSET